MLDDLIRTGFDHKPPFLVINGRPGTGKSTFLKNLEKHLIFDYDLGLGELDVRSINMQRKGFDDQMEMLEEVTKRPEDIKWVCFDSADKFETKVQQAVCADHEWKSIEQPGYGKGYQYVKEKHAKFLRYVKRMQQKGFGIAITCHAAVTKVNEPHIGESYDLYTSKLHKHIAADLYEAADALLFATIKSSVQKKTGDFGKLTTQNVVTGERILYTQPMTGVEAKNRFNLPAEIPLDAENLLNLIEKSRQTAAAKEKA